MNPQAPEWDPQSAADQLPPVEVLVADAVARFALAAHAYMSDEQDREPDLAAAETAIDVAGAAFERIKERLRPQDRLTMTQLLTETRIAFVRKRGL